MMTERMSMLYFYKSVNLIGYSETNDTRFYFLFGCSAMQTIYGRRVIKRSHKAEFKRVSVNNELASTACDANHKIFLRSVHI